MEVVAAAASLAGLASLTIQLGDIALKLTRLRKKYKDIPNILEDIGLEVTTLELHIQELQRCAINSRPDGTTSFQHDLAIQRCQRSTSEIGQLLGEFERLLNKSRGFGRLKVLLKEGEVNELLQKLQWGKSSLILATLALTEVQRKADHSAIVDRLQLHQDMMQQMIITKAPARLPQDEVFATVDDTPSPECPGFVWEETAEDDERIQPSREVSRRKGQRQPYQLTLSARFFNHVFTFAAVRSHSGWKAQILTYNVVPSDAEIFQYCKAGDLFNVRRLIEGGHASPLDLRTSEYYRSVKKETTLEVTAQHMHKHPEETLQLLQYLSRLVEYPDRTLLDAYVIDSLIYEGGGYQDQIDPKYFQKAIRSCNIDLQDVADHFISRHRWEYSINAGPPMPPEWAVQPPDMLEFTYYRLTGYYDVFKYDAQTFLRLCGAEGVDEDFAKRNRGGRSALHIAAHVLGRLECYPSITEDRRAEWRQLCEGLMKAGADEALENDSGQTPLECYLRTATGIPQVLTRIFSWEAMSRVTGKPSQWRLQPRGVTWRHLWGDVSLSLSPDVRTGSDDHQHFEDIDEYIVKRRKHFVVRHLDRPRIPGAWELNYERYFLDTQLIRPNDVERPSMSDEHYYIDYAPISIKKWKKKREELVEDLYRSTLECTQDDAGQVALCFEPTKDNSRQGEKRSASQPPCRARGGSVYAQRNVENRSWLPSVQRCPMLARRSICAFGEWDRWHWHYGEENDPGWDFELGLSMTHLTRCHEASSYRDEVWKHMGRQCGKCEPRYHFDEPHPSSYRCEEHETWGSVDVVE